MASASRCACAARRTCWAAWRDLAAGQGPAASPCLALASARLAPSRPACSSAAPKRAPLREAAARIRAALGLAGAARGGDLGHAAGRCTGGAEGPAERLRAPGPPAAAGGGRGAAGGPRGGRGEARRRLVPRPESRGQPSRVGSVQEERTGTASKSGGVTGRGRQRPPWPAAPQLVLVGGGGPVCREAGRSGGAVAAFTLRESRRPAWVFSSFRLTRSGRASRPPPGAPPDAAPARAARPLGHVDGLPREGPASSAPARASGPPSASDEA